MITMTPYQESLRGAPLIIDTDIGGDPDDSIALAVAARTAPELALVLTSDELGGERARFARYLLDVLGRPDVPVVAGRQLGRTTYFCIGGLTPSNVPSQTGDVVGAVGELAHATAGPVRWLGIGPMSNLADVLKAHPGLAGRLVVTQMAGALKHSDPRREEHNVRIDPAAAAAVLGMASGLRLVLSDVTFTAKIEVVPGHPVCWLLEAPGAAPWGEVIRYHMDRWFSHFHPGSMQHDALALSAALDLPFVGFATGHVLVDADGRMTRDPNGTEVRLSRSADYPAFMRWLEGALSGAHPAPATGDSTPAAMTQLWPEVSSRPVPGA